MGQVSAFVASVEGRTEDHETAARLVERHGVVGALRPGAMVKPKQRPWEPRLSDGVGKWLELYSLLDTHSLMVIVANFRVWPPTGAYELICAKAAHAALARRFWELTKRRRAGGRRRRSKGNGKAEEVDAEGRIRPQL